MTCSGVSSEEEEEGKPARQTKAVKKNPRKNKPTHQGERKICTRCLLLACTHCPAESARVAVTFMSLTMAWNNPPSAPHSFSTDSMVSARTPTREEVERLAAGKGGRTPVRGGGGGGGSGSAAGSDRRRLPGRQMAERRVVHPPPPFFVATVRAPRGNGGGGGAAREDAQASHARKQTKK